MSVPASLVVDDEQAFCTFVAQVAEGAGHRVPGTTFPGRVIDDLRTPGLSGTGSYAR